VERIAGDLGLVARAAAGRGGDILAGSLAKAIELLRVAASEAWSAWQIVEYLGRLVKEDEAHDSISARGYGESVVRIMNLHKVKGLEAPVVFLADPTGNRLHTPELYVDRSGESVLGYLAVHGTDKGSNRTILLAQPLGWEHFADAEARFQKAEELRLLYVAATRAGCGLTVSLRGSYPGRSPWTFFQTRLSQAPQLEDPGSRMQQRTGDLPISSDTVSQVAADIAGRWSHSVDKTYEVASVKALSVRKGRAIVSRGEHGTEWGSILHTLLETAMLEGNADLRALAHAALTEQGLSTDLVYDAIEEVRAVMRSEIWQRAKDAQKRLVEVPYQRLVPVAKDQKTAPTIIRGVIDLVFKEPPGWVIVDYKSDRITPDRTDALVESYAPQVASYAEAWTQITGEIVHEAGLYFTHLREYVPVMLCKAC
jgi:ATP-dependent helicase/nuclease subunit A